MRRHSDLELFPSPTQSAQSLFPAVIAVVIPCFKVTRHIVPLIQMIGREVDRVYVIDDACPEGSGRFVQEHVQDPRVQVVFHTENQGVGGAVLTGYQHALSDGADVIVKLDGDGQMDPALIPRLVQPILTARADYTKGNRFFDLESALQMPLTRRVGNAALSFLCKLSSGYWDIFDPTNGFTAIHSRVAQALPFAKISKRFYFEADMLFRLNTLGAVVIDIPMKAHYGEEKSNLHIHHILTEFWFRSLWNTGKRIFYNYYLRNFNLASVQLPLGLVLLLFGFVFGSIRWTISLRDGIAAASGSVMLAALPVILGTQFLLSFLAYDIQSTPRFPLHSRLFSPSPPNSPPRD